MPETPPRVAVVLGARGERALARRAQQGARLLLSGRAQLLLAVGGGAPPESARIRDRVMATGVASALVLEEPESRTTRDNAILAARLLRRHGLADRPVWLVTDRPHLPRARLCFWLAGLRTRPCAVPVDRPATRAWLREAAALLAYARHVPALRAEARRNR
jgi:uncharacterized SAM-binding protein YcdF (DUF218 family)